ncbi:cytochrome b/b6 domain-containing protein [Ancylobacter sp. MQZ15Z-1]|uniref:Cytochrome b/b6 domain-containing protein n=1 Tax=Ancylobacter mangrovi TaxID=2972472 RepID=A0A9X2T3A7_9HYPH|nr:cytochrome b/b6 domain-containing protein [Ancylobacter mangrovi]MCS0497150.1 cytochrome b/b6 domain-containing protein [Ancylobacter mangrovi]
MRERIAPAGDATSPATGTAVRVWDPVVRLFHWTVVAACILNLFILDDGDPPHRIVGYVVAGALAVRLVWGFIGTRYARFSDFVPTPSRLARYLAALAKGREPRVLGHNPAGAVMMLALMVLLAGVCLTGWMMGLDAFWGEDWLEGLHETLANAILVLALLHASAALFESWRHRENLVWSMVTGRKRA